MPKEEQKIPTTMIADLRRECLSDNEYFFDKDQINTKMHIPVLSFVHADSLDKDGYLNEGFANIFNPDNMGINQFWSEATKHFPLLSICGNIVKTKQQADYMNFIGAMYNGLVDYVDKTFQDFPQAKILEIGPGYGALQKYLKMEYSDINYHGLDVVKLYDSNDKVIIGNGERIPDELQTKDYDIVFSYNTFVHLSEKQRKSYIKTIYDILKPGGIFILSYPIAPDPLPPHKEYLQTKDGRAYYYFLGQFIPIPTKEEAIQDFHSFKYEIISQHGPHNEFSTILLSKPTEFIL